MTCLVYEVFDLDNENKRVMIVKEEGTARELCLHENYVYRPVIVATDFGEASFFVRQMKEEGGS